MECNRRTPGAVLFAGMCALMDAPGAATTLILFRGAKHPVRSSQVYSPSPPEEVTAKFDFIVVYFAKTRFLAVKAAAAACGFEATVAGGGWIWTGLRRAGA